MQYLCTFGVYLIVTKKTVRLSKTKAYKRQYQKNLNLASK